MSTDSDEKKYRTPTVEEWYGPNYTLSFPDDDGEEMRRISSRVPLDWTPNRKPAHPPEPLAMTSPNPMALEAKALEAADETEITRKAIEELRALWLHNIVMPAYQRTVFAHICDLALAALKEKT